MTEKIENIIKTISIIITISKIVFKALPKKKPSIEIAFVIISNLEKFILDNKEKLIVEIIEILENHYKLEKGAQI